MGKETSDFECRRAAKERRVLEAKLRLGVRPDYPDTPEQIAETEAFIKSMEPSRNQIISEQ